MIDISVVIPIYNGEKYIDKCLKSILNQTYKHYEVILIDNNSKDKSFIICQKYVKINENFHLISEKKPGPGCARNKGISLAKGEYITFLDCDDYWEPDYLEKMINTIKKNEKIDLVLCGRFYEEIDKKENKEKLFAKEKYNELIISADEIKKNPYAFFKYTGTRGPVCKFLKTKVILENNIYFPENINMMEDLCFCMYYISFCKNIQLIEPILYHQVIHNDSISKSNQLDNVIIWELVSNELKKVINKSNQINWTSFYYDLLNSFPLQCINMIIKQEKYLFRCVNSIYFFLKRCDIKSYLKKYCNKSILIKFSKNRIFIFKYVIKRKIKYQIFLIIQCLKIKKKV